MEVTKGMADTVGTVHITNPWLLGLKTPGRGPTLRGLLAKPSGLAPTERFMRAGAFARIVLFADNWNQRQLIIRGAAGDQHPNLSAGLPAGGRSRAGEEGT